MKTGLHQNKFKFWVKELKTKRWVIRKVTMSESIASPLMDPENGKIVVVGDRSFKNEFGTGCWIIENENETEWIIGLIDIPRGRKDHDAYRSKIGGLYGIVMAGKILDEIGNIQSGGI